MKILITGGTGFVGSALTARLLTAGHEVTAIGSSPPSAGWIQCGTLVRPSAFHS